MKKKIFQLIVRLNKLVLPSYSKKDPLTLSKFQQAILAYKYYTLIHSLD